MTQYNRNTKYVKITRFLFTMLIANFGISSYSEILGVLHSEEHISYSERAS